MKDESIVVRTPTTPAEQLILLFHGVGADAKSMYPFGQWLSTFFPKAAIVSVAAPYASDLGSGNQWFSVRNVTEDNRPTRVAAVMPQFLDTVQRWQATFTVTPSQTVLLGFSQGAIMALEASVAQDGVAGQVLALSGRYAKLPSSAPTQTILHLIHGESDPVIPVTNCIDAGKRLQALQANFTANVLPSVGHEITQEVARRAVECLQRPLQRSVWIVTCKSGSCGSESHSDDHPLPLSGHRATAVGDTNG
ncbi:MAG: esterase [Gammaproteobacteria bacterium]|nr:esterase [Gammaproteobacteria bacterium]